jgi:hypothetical protein
VHVHLGLHRLLCGILTPTGHPVTAHDRCAYQPDAAIETSARQRAGHRRYVAGVTAAYADPREILDDLILTVDAASTGIVDLEPGALLVDGRPVCTGDFLDAWALEVNEHLCDFAQRAAGGAGC